MTVPPMDPLVAEKVYSLHSTGGNEDVSKINELLNIYLTSDAIDIIGCYSEDGKWDCRVILDAFLSYSDELLANTVFLNSDGSYKVSYYLDSYADPHKFDPDGLDFGTYYRLSSLQMQILHERKLPAVIPAFIAHLRNMIDLYGIMSVSTEDSWIIGFSEHKDGKVFLRNALGYFGDSDSIVKGENEAEDNQRRSLYHSLIFNLGRMADEESFDLILDYCKQFAPSERKEQSGDVYRDTQYISTYYQDCLKIFTYYEDSSYVGFIIENADRYEDLDFYYSVFPSFALDESLYVVYTKSQEMPYISGDELVPVWKRWYEDNKEKIVWNKELGLFIEDGTYEKVKEYIESRNSKVIEGSTDYEIITEQRASIITRFFNWLKRLFG